MWSVVSVQRWNPSEPRERRCLLTSPPQSLRSLLLANDHVYQNRTHTHDAQCARLAHCYRRTMGFVRYNSRLSIRGPPSRDRPWS
jgi:hypothetical protein